MDATAPKPFTSFHQGDCDRVTLPWGSRGGQTEDFYEAVVRAVRRPAGGLGVPFRLLKFRM
jgi:hypothetical protein